MKSWPSAVKNHRFFIDALRIDIGITRINPLKILKGNWKLIKSSVSSFPLAFNEHSKMALVVSFRISNRIVRSEQAHSMAENWIEHCAKDTTMCMLEEKATKKLAPCALIKHHRVTGN